MKKTTPKTATWKPVSYKKIKTWPEFCKASKTPVKVPFDVSMLPKGLAKFLIANYKLAIIFAYFRGGVKFDYRSGNGQYKYYAWWWNVETSDELPSGFGLSNPYTFYDDEGSSVGSRLCSFDSSVTLHVMKHFNDLYVDLNLIKED